jgi:hypothetical protein
MELWFRRITFVEPDKPPPRDPWFVRFTAAGVIVLLVLLACNLYFI